LFRSWTFPCSPFLGLGSCHGGLGEVALANVLLLLFVIAKSIDKVVGCGHYLLIEAGLLIIVKTNWECG